MDVRSECKGRYGHKRNGISPRNCFLGLTLCCVSTNPCAARCQAGPAAQPSAATSARVPAAAAGVPYTAAQVASLLPPSVYFAGQTASLQLRNAAAVKLGGGIIWISLVDSSGYATDVQERYQFYLVTEQRLHLGDADLPAGAYGGGFLKDRFLIMDLGGRTVAGGKVETDRSLTRPRPLQLLPDTATSARLFLGRRWVSLRADTSANP